MRCPLVAVFCVVATPVLADMYPDASNAKQPEALNNLGKAGGQHYAPAYGTCTWDATHDVGPCVNQALAAAGAAGGTVAMPPGTYGLSTKIVWPTTKAVRLQCPSGGASGAATGVFRWIGAAGGRMVEVKAAAGARIDGAEIRQCGFDGNNGLAADGVYIASVLGGHFDDLTFKGGFSGGNVLTLTVDVGGAGTDTQNNTVDNLFIDNTTGGTYTSNQVYLGQVALAGAPGNNASLNHFRNILLNGAGGSTGIVCDGCDNNYFSGRIFNAKSVDLKIRAVGANLFGANGNVFSPIYYSGTFIARGQASVPACVPNVTCSYSNAAVVDNTNSTPAPTIETGADLHWGGNAGYAYGLSLIGKDGVQPALMAAGDNSIWGACRDNARAYGSHATAYLCNSVDAPVLGSDSMLGDRFFQAMSGSSGAKNYVFGRTAGTGVYQFNTAVRVTAMPTSCTGAGSGTLWNNAGVVNVCP